MAAFRSTREDSMLPDGDAAFEPRSDFVFDDGGEYSRMQNNLDTINGMGSSLVPDDFNPSFLQMLDNGDDSSTSAPWANGLDLQPPQTQTDIINARNMTVSNQWGQITPPQDVTPPDSSTSKLLPSTHSAHDIPSHSAQSTMSAKSERARHAANQRHSRGKRTKRDSLGKAEDPEQAEEVEDKKEQYRLKNRIAASKCRMKKKENTSSLEESARAASAENTRLRAEERSLRDLLSSMRDQALAHDPSSCNCQAVHLYNRRKAEELMGILPGATASQFERSRTASSGSFSSTRPQFEQTGRTQSTASSKGFVPQGSAGDDVMRHASTIGGVAQSPFAFAPAMTAQYHQGSPHMGGESVGSLDYVQNTTDGQEGGS
ncbi:hypothetical protein PRZ48_003612 [Zasmidium cellare]|uniref:BZIP domain-containing protein n=1 Tax=Zasmidium cellare TaxID=395010 RepID=A0ABR0EVK6_ZASCE|nr:hypothetical protein PRZ48_003612 [Zasmidium cellare]